MVDLSEPLVGENLANPSVTLQAEAFLQHLDPVVEQLHEELPQAGYDRRTLGILIGQLMQFQEDALGINVRRPVPAVLLSVFTSVTLAFVTESCHRKLLNLTTNHVWLCRRFKGSIKSNPRFRPSCCITSPQEALSLSWLQPVTSSKLVTHQSSALTFYLPQKGQRWVTAIAVQYSDITA